MKEWIDAVLGLSTDRVTGRREQASTNTFEIILNSSICFGFGERYRQRALTSH